jgi:hypothetical protein
MECIGSAMTTDAPDRRGAAQDAVNGLGFSPMGTRRRFLGWVPYQDWTPPFCAPFRDGKVIGHAPGPGPASLPIATVRRIVPSIPESRFGKGGGVCSGSAVSLGDESAEAPGPALVPKSDITSTLQDAGSRHVAPLRRWLR